MLGRGPLRDPFLFLTPYREDHETDLIFTPEDHLEVIRVLLENYRDYAFNEKVLTIALRKHIMWIAAGFNHCGQFREELFRTPDINETMKITEDFFLSSKNQQKRLNDYDSFMTSGHG